MNKFKSQITKLPKLTKAFKIRDCLFGGFCLLDVAIVVVAVVVAVAFLVALIDSQTKANSEN